jgi:CheY-like chemotaxis protein
MRTHVAVVDDDDAYLRAVRRSVGRHKAELSVAFLKSGGELLAHAQLERPSLVVMDVFMPELDGIETCQRLKARAETRDLIVVLASIALCREVAEAALEAGANRVLLKPYDVATVVAALLAPARIPSGTQTLDRIRDQLSATRTLASKLAVRVRPLVAHDDVDALAFLGLCDAALHWSAESGEPFRWFAERRVRETIDRELAQIGMRVPRHFELVRRVAAARWDLVCAGQDPTDTAVSVRLGVPPEQVMSLVARS